MYNKLQVRLVPHYVINIYTDLLCEQGDEVTVETKRGTALGVVTRVEPSKYKNPFAEGAAKRHVLENLTKGLKREGTLMGQNTVEVRHIASDKRIIACTDLDLRLGDIVVYERENWVQNCALPLYTDISMMAAWSVGIVVDLMPRAKTAQSWVINKVDIEDYVRRIERTEQLSTIKKQLDSKKKQYQDIELLKLIAATDPETKALLDQYIKLLGGEA